VLYCVHRYFFSRGSVYFSIRLALLNIPEHEAHSTAILLGDVERKDFEALLSVFYPDDLVGNDLSLEQWKSVLRLPTRWGFGSIRRRALNAINPLATPHDRLVLARHNSVDDWVVPALSALCERGEPLSLDEARQMNIDDVVLVARVRENIRGRALRVDAAEIPHRVEAAQAGTLDDTEDFYGLTLVPTNGTGKGVPSPVGPR